MFAFPMKESFLHYLLVVAALAVASVTAQSIIPAEILEQVPEGCHNVLDDAADCVLDFANFLCWAPMADLINDLDVPDPETADCFELQEFSCDFYDGCPGCNEGFTTFANCLKQEFSTPGVVTICDSASNSTDSNSTDISSNSTDISSNSTDSNSTDVGGCTNVTVGADWSTCNIGPGEC